MGVATQSRMQAEAVGIGTQGRPGGFPSTRDASQTQQFLPRARPHRNAISAGGRLPGRERPIGLDAGPVAFVLFRDEQALARQPPHAAGD